MGLLAVLAAGDFLPLSSNSAGVTPGLFFVRGPMLPMWIAAWLAPHVGTRVTRIIPPPYFWLGAEAERA